MKRLAQNTLVFAAVTFLCFGLLAPTVYAEKATPGYNNKITSKIMTPDKVETRIGTLDPWFDKTWQPGDFELVK